MKGLPLFAIHSLMIPHIDTMSMVEGAPNGLRQSAARWRGAKRHAIDELRGREMITGNILNYQKTGFTYAI
jgi:hypothetical protein